MAKLVYFERPKRQPPTMASLKKDDCHFRTKEVKRDQDLNCLSVSSCGDCHVVSAYIAKGE
jgi:hypothetical protein